MLRRGSLHFITLCIVLGVISNYASIVYSMLRRCSFDFITLCSVGGHLKLRFYRIEFVTQIFISFHNTVYTAGCHPKLRFYRTEYVTLIFIFFTTLCIVLGIISNNLSIVWSMLRRFSFLFITLCKNWESTHPTFLSYRVCYVDNHYIS